MREQQYIGSAFKAAVNPGKEGAFSGAAFPGETRIRSFNAAR